MAIPSTTKYFFLLTILMVSLDGINSQLTISVVDVPDNIDTMLENITVTSATTANTLNQIVDTQGRMANADTQMVSLLQMQNEHLQNICDQQCTISTVVDVPDNIDTLLENITVTSATTANTLNQIVDTQMQLANAVTQMVNLLQMQNEHLQNMTTTMAHIVGQLDTQNQLISSPAIPRDCSDLASRGQYPSGSYTIRPWDDLGNLRVYCDMDTDSGGWTVFQKRFDGSVDFYLGWDAYEDGFGSLDGEFWIGLRQIYRLTRQGNWTLRIDLHDFENDTVYAEYRVFSVSDAESFYRLSVGAYSGTAGDSLTWHNNQAFITKDRNHDTTSSVNCAQDWQGAWWYKSCALSNLNGLYLGASQSSHTGMIWYHWKSSREVLKRSEMKMRRIQ